MIHYSKNLCNGHNLNTIILYMKDLNHYNYSKILYDGNILMCLLVVFVKLYIKITEILYFSIKNYIYIY